MSPNISHRTLLIPFPATAEPNSHKQSNYLVERGDGNVVLTKGRKKAIEKNKRRRG